MTQAFWDDCGSSHTNLDACTYAEDVAYLDGGFHLLLQRPIDSSFQINISLSDFPGFNSMT